MLNEFQTFNADRSSLDELIGLAAYGRLLRAEYEQQKVDEPEFVDTQLKAIRREINARVADHREARRRSIEAQLAGLETASEKRERLQRELEKLKEPVHA